MTISAFSDELAQVRTKKKEFLSQIERIVPWKEWLAMIQPCYYKGERGNKPYPLEIMLRLYLLQNLYDLSDEATVAEAIDSRAFSEFCGVDSSNQVPDGDTLGRFRNLLIKNGLQEKLFAQVVAALMERGLILKKGTIVDSTIISAPSSTKNKEKKRDPDAHQVKKGNTWHFGYKAHIGVDKDSGLVHTVEATPAYADRGRRLQQKRRKQDPARGLCRLSGGQDRQRGNYCVQDLHGRGGQAESCCRERMRLHPGRRGDRRRRRCRAVLNCVAPPNCWKMRQR